MIKFYGYSKCSTARKAKNWLEENNLEFENIEIVSNFFDFNELKAVAIEVLPYPLGATTIIGLLGQFSGISPEIAPPADLTTHDNVTPETRARVEATIQRLGYKPSGLAQALATNKSTYIGVVIPSANYVYIANVLNGINEVAKEKGFSVILLVTSHKQKDALKMSEKVITSHVDGAIIFDDDLDHDQIAKIGSYNVPIVVINNNVKGERVASIELDYEKNLRETLSKVLETPNHPKMTFLHVSNAGRLLDRMEKVFVDLHHEHSSSYEVYDCDDSYTKTYNDFSERFKTTKTGYFIAYRDSIAAAIINAATDSGLRVPEDIEVLSMIGTKYANIITNYL